MDTLALGIIAIGVVAAIGVVVVAMGGDNGTQATAAQAPTEATTPPVAKPRARPRPRQRPQAVPQAGPAYVVAPPRHNGYATGHDPLIEGFMQVVAGELDTLRSQQEKIDQRLKLINGIAELMHDMQPAANNNGHRRTTARG